jgi:hypothetical protein
MRRLKSADRPRGARNGGYLLAASPSTLATLREVSLYCLRVMWS